MGVKIKKYLLLIAILFFFTMAISTNAYVLSGYVFNSSGAPLANVPVELLTKDYNPMIWNINKTNGNGYYEFTNLPPGLYEFDANDYDDEDYDVVEYPPLEGYTTVDFENENVINLTDSLEINATLLAIDVDLELLGCELPRFIDTDYIESGNIYRISKFRSGIGHDYSDGFESCRSMKHYFVPNGSVDWSELSIFSPVDGTVREIFEEWAGTQLRITPTGYPEFTITIFHINLTNSMNVSDNVTAGQQLGTHIGSQTTSDIAVRVNSKSGEKLVSYFDVMTDDLFNTYKSRGIGSREVMKISEEERDSDPLICDGEQFNNTGSLENWIYLNTEYPAKENPEICTYSNGETIAANVTVRNNEGFDLINWRAVFGVDFENETDEEELYFNLTLTNISAGESKSHIFTYQIPENIPYKSLKVLGAGADFDWNVVSSQGNLASLMYRIDEREINIVRKINFNISLSQGWNLFSIPLILINNTLPLPLESIEGNYTSVYAYMRGIWYSYLAGEPPSSKDMDPARAFLINMTNDDILELEGYEIENPEFEFYLGWNLIGIPSLNSSLINETLKDVNYSAVYLYNSTWTSYIPGRMDSLNSLKEFVPGYGYWVRVE